MENLNQVTGNNEIVKIERESTTETSEKIKDGVDASVDSINEEISQKKEKAFIQILSWNYKPEFNPNKNVCRIEFQLRRERLKDLMLGSGLYENLENVINSIPNLWSYLITRFVHKGLTNKEVHEQITQLKILKDGTFKYLASSTLRQRFQDAEISFVWDSIQTFEKKQAPNLQRIKDIKKPEVEYVKNGYKTILSTFIKLF